MKRKGEKYIYIYIYSVEELEKENGRKKKQERARERDRKTSGRRCDEKSQCRVVGEERANSDKTDAPQIRPRISELEARSRRWRRWSR